MNESLPYSHRLAGGNRAKTPKLRQLPHAPLLVAATALACLLAACQHQPKPNPPLAQAPSLPPEQRAELAARNAEVLELATDPCAVRLQDLGGALALFYHQHQGFPEKLEDVTPTAHKLGFAPQFTDPVAGEPFAYIPSGLSVPGQLRRLLLYQQSPDAKGLRWGLVMSPPPQGMIVVTPEVVHLTPEVLNAYLASAPKPPSRPAPAP